MGEHCIPGHMKLNSEQPIKTGVLIEDRGQVFYLKDPSKDPTFKLPDKSYMSLSYQRSGSSFLFAFLSMRIVGRTIDLCIAPASIRLIYSGSTSLPSSR